MAQSPNFIHLDHASIHLVWMAKEHTWEKKGFKDIKAIDMENKHHVTTCVSPVANGTLLPMQDHLHKQKQLNVCQNLDMCKSLFEFQLLVH